MKTIDIQSAFERYLLAEKRVSKNTFEAYRNDIAQFIAYLKDEQLAFEQCGEKELKRYVQDRARTTAPRTLSRKISSLKLFYQFVAQRIKIVPNVADVLVCPKIEKSLPVYLTEQELVTLFEAAARDESLKGVRNYLMIQLLYATGMRISELVELTVDQFHPETGFITVNGKGGRQRDVPLPHGVSEHLVEYINKVYPQFIPTQHRQKSVAYLFASVRCGRVVHMTRQSFWVILKKLLLVAGIEKNVSPHTLRHSLATHLLNNGADIRSLQTLLGHANISTVEIYTHLENKQVRRVYDSKHPRAE